MADITKIDTLIQSSPHPAWSATTQGYCVHANVALERLTGFSSEEINQADWRRFLLEEDRAVASASWQWSLATRTPYRVQVRRQPLDRFRIRGSRLCWLILLFVIPFSQWPLSLGQTPPSVKMRVGHDSWTFKEGAAAEVTCLAQTTEGFLWLGSPGAPANLAFTIQPAFYQTAWFRSLVVFLFLAALTGFYRRRLRQLERQRDVLRKSEKALRDVIDTI